METGKPARRAARAARQKGIFAQLGPQIKASITLTCPEGSTKLDLGAVFRFAGNSSG